MDTSLAHDVIGAWQTNCRINLYLLDALDDAQIAVPLQKGKSVGNQFAHMNSVRIMWLKASDPELVALIEKPGQTFTRDILRQRLGESGAAIEQLIRAGLETGRIKNFKPNVTSFLCYLVAHESNHRAQVEVALRQAGQPLPDKVAYGIWEWGTR